MITYSRELPPLSQRSSFPFFHLANELGLPYATVYIWADYLFHGCNRPEKINGSLTARDKNLIWQAVVAEMERRSGISIEDSF